MTDKLSDTLQTILQRAFEAFDNGDYDTALTLYRRAETAYSPEPGTLRHIRYMTGFTHAQAGNQDEARRIYRDLLHRVPDETARHRTLHQLAMVERLAGNFDAARGYLQQEWEILADLPGEQVMPKSANLYEQGILHHLEGDSGRAKQHLKRSLKFARQSDDPVSRACALRGLGDAYAATDQVCAARDYYQRSLDEFQQVGDSHGADEIHERLTRLPDSDDSGTA
jgi:tetratricopeptide (TPR) repeat protein